MAKTLMGQNINVLWSSLIIDEIVKNNINYFFISPGNRNAPLISALASNGDAVKKICFDERGAGYMALGHAKATGLPGVLVCTSGTALSNYFPSVIEASRDGLPMVILSADRPPELLGSDANQTIDQQGIFGRYSRMELNLPCPAEDFSMEALLSKIDHILQFREGPVHINCQFRDPLIPAADEKKKVSEQIMEKAKTIFECRCPRTYYPNVNVKAEIPGEIIEIINKTERGLLVIGRLHPHENKKNIKSLIKGLGWPVFCDIGSSLKHEVPAAERIFDLDLGESARIIRQYSPDTVLHLGSGLVSKQFYDTVLNQNNLKYITVNPGRELRDPAHRADIKLTMDTDSFAKLLMEKNSAKRDNPSKKILISSINMLEKAVNAAIPGNILTFPMVAKSIIGKIPGGHSLFLGNSITVREFDRAVFPTGKELQIVINRGVSGIEGNIATAIGYAWASGRTATAVIGDISFLHDLNSLAYLKNSSVPVILVVANNRGGRIFERLPINNFPEIMDPYITSPHEMEFHSAADLFNLPYAAVSSPGELSEAYEIALQKNISYIIEVKISSGKDLEVFNRIKKCGTDRGERNGKKI